MIGVRGRAARRRAAARLAACGVLGVDAEPGVPRRQVAGASVLAGLGLAVLARSSRPLALALGVAAVVATWAVLRRLVARQARLERGRRMVGELPTVLDLLGACLAAGASVAEAVGEVGLTLRGPLASALVPIGRALARGVAPARAWASLTEPAVPEEVAALARAAVRAAATGSALQPWLAALAEEARAARAAAAAEAAQRAGVRAVVPLGLCALPAYVLLGVVPAVVGLLRGLV